MLTLVTSFAASTRRLSHSGLPTPEICLHVLCGMPIAGGTAGRQASVLRRVFVSILLTLSISGLVLRSAELLYELLPPSRPDLLQPSTVMTIVQFVVAIECIVTHAVILFGSKGFTDALDHLTQFASQFPEVERLRRRPTRLAMAGFWFCVAMVSVYYLAVQIVFDDGRTQLINYIHSALGGPGVLGVKAAKCVTFFGQIFGWFGASAFFFVSVEHLGCAAEEFGSYLEQHDKMLTSLQNKLRDLVKLTARIDAAFSALTVTMIICSAVYITLLMYSVVRIIGLDSVDWFQKAQLLLWLAISIAKMFLVMWRAASLNDRLEESIQEMKKLKASDLHQVQFCIKLANDNKLGITNWQVSLLQRKTMLSTFGVLATYFVVMLQFNPASSPSCNCWCNGTLERPL